jgi:hypothetical protein
MNLLDRAQKSKKREKNGMMKTNVICCKDSQVYLMLHDGSNKVCFDMQLSKECMHCASL